MATGLNRGLIGSPSMIHPSTAINNNSADVEALGGIVGINVLLVDLRHCRLIACGCAEDLAAFPLWASRGLPLTWLSRQWVGKVWGRCRRAVWGETGVIGCLLQMEARPLCNDPEESRRRS